MNPDNIPEVQEGDRLGAGHVNILSQGVKKIFKKESGGYGAGSYGGPFSAPPPFVLRSCKITELGFEGEDEDDNVYTIKTRYFDPTDKTWKDDDEGGEFCLDDRQSETGYAVDDVIQAYFDTQRNAFVPLASQGIQLYHGIIIEQCNTMCSTYRVQRVRRYLTQECVDCSDSNSNSESS